MKERDLRVSFSAVVWGGEMRLVVGVEESGGVGVKRGWRCVRRDMCSSDVPDP